jgi:hypothetical protein
MNELTHVISSPTIIGAYLQNEDILLVLCDVEEVISLGLRSETQTKIRSSCPTE